MASALVSELTGRSDRLGADPRDTTGAGGWDAGRAAVHGVPEEMLGEHDAQRTLLGREVLPHHVAHAALR